MNNTIDAAGDQNDRCLFKIGGIAALVVVLFIPIQIVVYIQNTPPGTAIDYFALFQVSWLRGLLAMDLLILPDYVLILLVTVALYAALRRTSESFMLLALVFGVTGAVTYFASNTAFEMLALSQRYAVAVTDAHRAMYLAAGQAMLTTYTGTAFHMSYIIGSVVMILISCVMLRGHVFSRNTAYLGIFAGALGFGLMRDMSVFFMGGIGVITLLLLIIFRTMRGILLPLSVVVLSVIWTIGLMGLTGATMSHATEAMPILIMSIAVADSIHILSQYNSKSVYEKNNKRLTLLTMGEMNTPVIMTSCTTMAGFLALTISSFGESAKLGIFTAAGVFFAMFLSITFVPALLSWLQIPKILRKRRGATWDSRLLARWGTLLASNRKVLSPLVVLLLVFSGIGISQLEHSYSQVDNFPQDHPVHVAYDRINQHFAGTTTFDIMVESVDQDAMKNPVMLTDLDSLKTKVMKMEHVGAALSLADVVKRMNKVLNANDEAYYAIPTERILVSYLDFEERNGTWFEVNRTDTVAGREQIAQFLALYEMSGQPEDLANMVDYNYQNARMTIFLNSDDLQILRSVKNELDVYITDHFEGA
ncbi:MMPL family transporter, partial [Candidatus Neomarinimicrobiota bacterium]